MLELDLGGVHQEPLPLALRHGKHCELNRLRFFNQGFSDLHVLLQARAMTPSVLRDIDAHNLFMGDLTLVFKDESPNQHLEVTVSVLLTAAFNHYLLQYGSKLHFLPFMYVVSSSFLEVSPQVQVQAGGGGLLPVVHGAGEQHVWWRFHDGG